MDDVWDELRICVMPEKYKKSEIYCSDCELYPYWCNKHPMRFKNRNTSKPLIWKMGAALNNGRRKDALKLLKQFIKVVQAVRNE